MTGTGELTVDDSTLNAVQRRGDACVACNRRWPRPRFRIGRVPDGGGVYACDECAEILPVHRRNRGPSESRTDAGGPVSVPAPVGVAAGR